MIFLTDNTAFMLSAYETVRKAIIEQSSVSVSAALGIAYLILVFKLANIAFKGMSDEQGAGYGGIKLMDIIRPLIIVFTIQNAPTVCSVIDSISVKIASSITDSVSDTKKEIDATTYVTREFSSKYNQMSDLAEAILKGQLQGVPLEETLAAYGFKKTKVNLTEGGGIGAGDMGVVSIEKGNADLLFNLLAPIAERNTDIGHKQIQVLTDSGEQNLDNRPDLIQVIRGDGGATQVISWLFTIVSRAMRTFSQILLIILAFFFPWTLVFCLFERWKNAWIGWMGRYIQISMWPVVISLIWFSTYALIDGVKVCMISNNCDGMMTLINEFQESIVNSGSVSADLAAQVAQKKDICDSYFMMYSGIALAGLIALFKLSSIVEMIFPMPEGGSGTGDAGGAVAAGAASVLQKGGNVAGNTATMAAKVTPHVAKAMSGAAKTGGSLIKGLTR